MMAKVFKRADATPLGLPGRNSFEIVSGTKGSNSSTLRLVEIAVPVEGEALREFHHHPACEECIVVLSGEGTTHTEHAQYQLQPGDTLLIPAGERHVTRNTGSQPLMLLCFFPVADIAPVSAQPISGKKSVTS
jgi:mannose-6-phosphate isomerase-like protein (cupin superfamily)